MTTSPSPAAASQSSSNGASPASLPRWRSFLSTLNWRRDPGYELRTRLIEQRTRETEIAILRERQKRLQIEKQIEQMKREDERLEREDERLEREHERLEREHEQMRREDEQLEKEEEELANEDEQIESEIEQLRLENARLKTLLACVDQLCFPPESNSSPQTSTEPDCGPSSP